MLVNLSQTLTLAASPEEAWSLVRDARRMAGLIPGVEYISPSGGGSEGATACDSESSPAASATEKHAARVNERVGPFRLSLNLQVSIVKAVELSLLEAELSGSDNGGQNRLSGSLRAGLMKSEPGGTLLSLNASVEVMGKLAALGAAPIRRRANEVFGEFTGRLQAQFPTDGEQLREG